MKKQKRKQLLDSLFSRYSIKTYEIPVHIFNHLLNSNYKRGRKRRQTPPHYHDQKIALVSRNKNGEQKKRTLIISRPNRNKKHNHEEFLAQYISIDTSRFPFSPIGMIVGNPYWFGLSSVLKIIKIPHKQQLFLCMNARPMK